MASSAEQRFQPWAALLEHAGFDYLPRPCWSCGWIGSEFSKPGEGCFMCGAEERCGDHKAEPVLARECCDPDRPTLAVRLFADDEDTADGVQRRYELDVLSANRRFDERLELADIWT